MDPMSSGLRFRLRRAARHTAEQHRHLREILRDFDSAVAAGDRSWVAEVFALYRSALEAHFALEEDVLFPALHGLHPEHRAELEALADEHVELAAVLERLAAGLERDSMDRFGGTVRGLVKTLGRHEQREERLVRSLTKPETPPDPDGPGSSPSSSGVESSS